MYGCHRYMYTGKSDDPNETATVMTAGQYNYEYWKDTNRLCEHDKISPNPCVLCLPLCRCVDCCRLKRCKSPSVAANTAVHCFSTFVAC